MTVISKRGRGGRTLKKKTTMKRRQRWKKGVPWQTICRGETAGAGREKEIGGPRPDGGLPGGEMVYQPLSVVTRTPSTKNRDRR